ncbi:MAG: transporter substrate-binding domain-containing protein [Bacillota bacterium]|jgi:glutamine transport system permease protein
MKKTLLVLSLCLVAVMMCLTFAACGSSGDDAAADADAGAAGPYTIYSDNAFAPFEFLDEETNEYVGIDMELLAAIAEDQGFEYEVKNEGFDASMGAVQSGQADAMIAGMTITEERAETFDFSEGYFEDGQILVAPENSDVAAWEDLSGKKLAAKTGTMGADYAAANADKYGYTVEYYEDSPTMYTAVTNGANAACVEDYNVICWAIEQGEVQLATVGDIVNPAYYGFAVKKGQNAELLDMFNAGLANIKDSGKYDEILAKYGYGE